MNRLNTLKLAPLDTDYSGIHLAREVCSNLAEFPFGDNMKLCKDGRIWGQNNKEAREHLGVSIRTSLIRKGTASESKKGKNNPMYGKTGYWANKKGYWANKKRLETGKKISETMIKRGTAKGENNSHYGKPCPHTKRIYYKGICMKSPWEARIAQLADKNNIKWSYEPKRFYFKNCTYLPDFYFPKWNLWVEVKGWMTDEAKRRINLFKKSYNLLIIDGLLYKKYCEEKKLC